MSNLSLLLSQHASLSSDISEIESLYQKQHYHNLTEPLIKLVRKVASMDGSSGLKMYQQYVKEFDTKLNCISVAQMVESVCEYLQDKEAGSQLVGDVQQRMIKANRVEPTASYMLTCQLAQISIEIAQKNSGNPKLFEEHVKNAKKLLASANDKMKDHGFVENEVNAKYYWTQSSLLKLLDEPNDFYRSALMFLAYQDVNTIPLDKKRYIAYDLGICALVGDRLYNFGELMGHPIIESLKDSQAGWLLELLHAFNNGDIPKFKQIREIYEKIDVVLNRQKQFLEEKIQLMAFLELIFQRCPDQRVLSFQEIQSVTHAADVELLLLKSLALNLIKGKINQVDKSVYVSWSQPRVLDRPQIQSLKDKIDNWRQKVEQMRTLIEAK